MSEQIWKYPSNFTPSAGAKVFTYGLCANALVVIHSVGLLTLLQSRDVNINEIYDSEKYPDSVAIKGALLVLQYGEIIDKIDDKYSLTTFGNEVMDELPSFLHWFESYSKLLGKSVMIAQGKEKAELEDFSMEEVAFTGDLVKKRFLPVMKKVMKEIHIQGDFCDLWCGTGNTIIDICNEFQVNGLGFDKSQAMVDVANKNLHWAFQSEKFYGQAHLADITAFKGSYPEVDILYTNFITHHLNPDSLCTETLCSLKQAFPNARYLLLIDGVTPTNQSLSPLIFSPAFDYIHRLQRIETRNKERLDKIIQDTGYTIVKEIEIDFPNHYLWVLGMLK
ncbi:class I SAM-dependent methyltransferase [Shimazuella kribbensis]|uniref:class I SAM-dependent methyltransferase n=1 Tax=Shimazuella kribbensis TaxID=139808 RepID=UPI000411AEA6|nr:class I SAM-dependent methyltransferase [Shimazuella kribbensis]